MWTPARRLARLLLIPGMRATTAEKTLSTEFETILPTQFADRHRAPLSPEQRLMAAVLEDAINIRRRGPRAAGRRARPLYAEVRRWFASDDTTWPFSFVNVCHGLGLEPTAVRSGAHVLDGDEGEWRIAHHLPTVASGPPRVLAGRRLGAH
jgi:hypothetical protein